MQNYCALCILSRNESLWKKLGYKLVKGASKAADELIYRIYKEKGFETLELVAKTNYKNVTKQNLS